MSTKFEEDFLEKLELFEKNLKMYENVLKDNNNSVKSFKQMLTFIDKDLSFIVSTCSRDFYTYIRLQKMIDNWFDFLCSKLIDIDNRISILEQKAN